MRNTGDVTDHVEAHAPEADGVAVLGQFGALGAAWQGHLDWWRFRVSIRENGVDFAGHGFDHVLQELPGCLSVRIVNELGYGRRARAVCANEHRELSVSSLHLRDDDMKESDRIAL